MNWVEKQHARRMKIEAECGPVLNDVAAAVNDAINSFNYLYRSTKPITVNATPNRIAISLPLPLPKVVGERVRSAEAVVGLGSDGIHAVFHNCSAHPVDLELDADESGVFMRTSDGSRVLDADSASRILLEEYLKGIKP
jgi:hypothetical protein